MASVFISGSRNVTELTKRMKEVLDNLILEQNDIIIGDAQGVDKIVQEYLLSKEYFNVTVYFATDIPRNKISNKFKEFYVFTSSDKSFRDRMTIRDAVMTHDANYGIVFWDGFSKGSRANIKRLESQSKRCLVILNSNTVDVFDRMFSHVKNDSPQEL